MKFKSIKQRRKVMLELRKKRYPLAVRAESFYEKHPKLAEAVIIGGGATLVVSSFHSPFGTLLGLPASQQLKTTYRVIELTTRHRDAFVKHRREQGYTKRQSEKLYDESLLRQYRKYSFWRLPKYITYGLKHYKSKSARVRRAGTFKDDYTNLTVQEQKLKKRF